MASPHTDCPLHVDPKSKEWLGYRDQRNNARTRGIPFLLTYSEWLSIWKRSGKFHRRGRKSGCFVMARKGDQGAYEVGNVVIISHEDNSSQPHFGRVHIRTAAWRKQHSAAIKAWTGKPGVKKMLSKAGKLGAKARWGSACP